MSNSNRQPHLHRVPRWYFGGLAATYAACITHPLELLKVHLQTVATNSETSILRSTWSLVKQQGVLSLYSGLTAGIVRQMATSTTRFAIYEMGKLHLGITGDVKSKQMPFYQKVLLSGFSGACGGFMAAPADMVNVRMQNDIKLPREARRKYILFL